MTILEEHTLRSVCSSLPEIAKCLEKIATQLASISAVMLGDSEVVKIVNDIKKMKGEA